jgi:hypothetical protein
VFKVVGKKKICQMRSAHDLLQDWDGEAIFNGNCLVVIAMLHMTMLVDSQAWYRKQALDHMMGSGGKPISLVRLSDGDGGIGTCAVGFCLTEK